ncbi:hypothetical protein HAX54_049860, partial [Datura stramonium]|nr:hypothetical protein [Datura stramonium]
MEVLTAQHMSRTDHMEEQDKEVVELQKALATRASNNARISNSSRHMLEPKRYKPEEQTSSRLSNASPSCSETLLSAAPLKLRERLTELKATTWIDVHNSYKSKIRIKGQAIVDVKEVHNRRTGFDLTSTVIWIDVTRGRKAKGDQNIWCKYQETQVNIEEVVILLKNGHLKEFLSDRAKEKYGKEEEINKDKPDNSRHMINMIIGGEE